MSTPTAPRSGVAGVAVLGVAGFVQRVGVIRRCLGHLVPPGRRPFPDAPRDVMDHLVTSLGAPRNLAYIIRDGIVPREGERSGWMPAFEGALTDAQLTDLLTYLRALSGQPAWSDVAGEVKKISKGQK